MEKQATKIKVTTTVTGPVAKVWQYWTTPADVIKWNTVSEDWHTPRAENDLKEGGNFLFRMEAKDKSIGFDFAGVYDKIIPNELIEYTLTDGRKVSILFMDKGSETSIEQTFDAETQNSEELQRGGWQAILNSFKQYIENEKMQ
jgi:uncharacterized protein YndB with AHSA1/START domain